MRSPNSRHQIIGLTGHAAVGKDRLANIMVDRGFTHCSLGDIVREEIIKQHMVPSRTLQTKIANELRAEHGGDYLMRRAVELVGPADRSVISGLYSVSEGSYLVAEKKGVLVGVLADRDPKLDMKIRYKRLISRADGSRDDLSFEQFQAAFDREQSGSAAGETNVKKLLQMAGHVILNSDGMTPDDILVQLTPIIGEN